jgi:hypothetical protein
MNQLLRRLEFGWSQAGNTVHVRDSLREVFQKLFPDFEIPEAVSMTLEDLSDELLKLTLVIPGRGRNRGRRPGYVFDLYENFAYLFGKGYYDAKTDGSDETMVWYVPKHQRKPKAQRIAFLNRKHRV